MWMFMVSVRVHNNSLPFPANWAPPYAFDLGWCRQFNHLEKVWGMGICSCPQHGVPCILMGKNKSKALQFCAMPRLIIHVRNYQLVHHPTQPTQPSKPPKRSVSAAMMILTELNDRFARPPIWCLISTKTSEQSNCGGSHASQHTINKQRYQSLVSNTSQKWDVWAKAAMVYGW